MSETMAYQHTPTRMAPGAALDDLTQKMQDATRVIRTAVPVMSSTESQLLSDVSRGRGLAMLCQLCGVSERAFREADALSVAEAVRGHILARRRHRASGLLGVLQAFRDEEATNGPANLAQWAFVTSPSRATRDAAIETLVQQEVASRLAVDVLHTTDLASARSFVHLAPSRTA